MGIGGTKRTANPHQENRLPRKPTQRYERQPGAAVRMLGTALGVGFAPQACGGRFSINGKF